MLKLSLHTLLACLAISLWLFALPARADTITFTSATPVVLTSPSTTLTIATGSVADSVTVSATSIMVGLSAATGGSFTLLSPVYHLAVTTTGVGGTAAYTCAAQGLSTLALSQTSGATTYTITPTTASCPVVTPVPVGGSGYLPPSFVINGGAGSTVSPTVALSFATPPTVTLFDITTSHGNENITATSSYASTLSLNLCVGLPSCSTGTYLVSINFLDSNGAFIASSSQSIDYAGIGAMPSSTATSSVPSTSASSTITITTRGAATAHLQALLTTLEAQLQTLLQEAAAKGIVIEGVPTSVASSSQYVFTRNLAFWDRGQDVNELQRYLVAQNSGPAAEALARHGATDTFGSLTFAALKEFQKKAGIVPDSGYFGPLTRGYIKAQRK